MLHQYSGAFLMTANDTRQKAQEMLGLNASVAVDLSLIMVIKVILKSKIRASGILNERWIHTRFIAGESAK